VEGNKKRPKPQGAPCVCVCVGGCRAWRKESSSVFFTEVQSHTGTSTGGLLAYRSIRRESISKR
jgi:hypothetical protein